MGKSLSSFIKEIKIDVVEFEKQYKENNIQNPEQYPLIMTDDNEGLWFEFFVGFCEAGEM
jgi:hypothetical protein